MAHEGIDVENVERFCIPQACLESWSHGDEEWVHVGCIPGIPSMLTSNSCKHTQITNDNKKSICSSSLLGGEGGHTYRSSMKSSFLHNPALQMFALLHDTLLHYFMTHYTLLHYFMTHYCITS